MKPSVVCVRGCIALALSFAPSVAAASHTCPTPQPAYAYVDVDNDGCHTMGVDSASVDADLQAAMMMSGVPSFVAPPDTGLVIPVALAIPDEADPFWSVPNDVWIDGAISGDSALRIEAGGTTHVNAMIRMKSRGFSDDSDVTLGCTSGCGPTVVDDGVRLGTTGHLMVWDAVIGNDVRLDVKCEPGGVPSCGGQARFERAASIGNGVRVNSPGGIYFYEGTSLLTIGNDVRMSTKAVSTDGGTLGFPILFELAAGVSFGPGARLRAGGEMRIEGGEGPPFTGPVSFEAGTRLQSSTLILRGSSLQFGGSADLRAKKSLTVPGQLSTLILGATDGPLVISGDTKAAAGRMAIDAGNGVLVVANGVSLSTAGANQYIDLAGDEVAVSANVSISKSTSDAVPISIAAVSSLTVATSELRGAGIDVSVSGPGASIAFTGSEAKGGGADTSATFVAPGGSCDLTGSTFSAITLDTSGCGAVVGP